MSGVNRRGMAYSEELIAAVRYLMSRGIVKTTEIARRLDVSPYTVRNIKQMLKERDRLSLIHI